jgi:hypothetical protein
MQVRCDSSNNTPSSIAAGFLNVTIALTPREAKLKGLAPVYATHARRFLAAVLTGNSFEVTMSQREGDSRSEGNTLVFADGSVAEYDQKTCSWAEGEMREPANYL